MASVLSWLGARLAEPSTWAGISAAVTAVSSAVQSKSGLAAALVAALVAIVKAESGSST